MEKMYFDCCNGITFFCIYLKQIFDCYTLLID